MIEITLQKLQTQQFTVTLQNQPCTIRLFCDQFNQQPYTFMDLSINNKPLFHGVICLNGNKIVRQSYLGFKGEFVFLDLQGCDDPFYTEFGDRFKLYYLTEGEINVQ